MNFMMMKVMIILMVIKYETSRKSSDHHVNDNKSIDVLFINHFI